MLELGAKGLVPGIFAENITTEGMDLCHLPLGTRLEVGDAVLEVTQIGKECHHHCQVYQQVGMCAMPLEGIFTRVIKGGAVKAGTPISVQSTIRAAVVTVSDKGSQGLREDRSGPVLVETLKGYAVVNRTAIIPDERELISKTLADLADTGEIDLILTTGGTGLAPRDVTPEATLAIVDRLVPGIPEAMRAASLKITDRAMLSRAASGTRGRTLIINLPGSPKAAKECLEVFLPVLDHAVETLRGEAYECARKDESSPNTQ
jgi:molybdenum cofactor synthesis domain-containing protein